MSATILIFDLDGTLVDSVPDLTKSLNQVLGEHGYGPLTPAEVAPMVGDGVPALVERGFAARGGSPAEAADALPRYIAIYEAHATDLTRPYPDVPESWPLAPPGISHRGLHQQIAAGERDRARRARPCGAVRRGGRRRSLRVRKPDKGHLLGLIAELGGTADRAVMIGDSENDAAVAHAAAVPLVIMRYGYARRSGDARRRCAARSFSGLPAALERLGLAP